MKALVYHRSVPRYLLSRMASRLSPHRFFPGLSPLRLEDVAFPTAPDDWVTLRPRLCGICGSDLALLRGAQSFLMEPYASLPAVLGHEVVAEVISTPAGFGLSAGDRVVVDPLLCCEVRGLPPCRFCAQGDYNLCENFTAGGPAPGAVAGYNRTAGGGMAEAMVAHPHQLLRVPDDLPDEKAVLTDSLATPLQAVMDHFPEDDDVAVVYGAGILGQHIVRCLKALGSRARVIVVARHIFQGELARAGGADTILLRPSRSELGQAAGARYLPTTLDGGNLEGGADLVYDCVGSARSLQDGLLILRGRGTLVMVGAAARLDGVDLSSLWFRELRVTGSFASGRGTLGGRTVRTCDEALHLLGRRDFPTDGLLTHTLPLAEYARALQIAFDHGRHRSAKVAIDLRPPTEGQE